jgi:hypothetical protein
VVISEAAIMTNCTALLLGLGLALSGCADDGAPPEVGSPPAIVASRDLGPLEQAATIQARDGGYSAVIAGRAVWLYGDSILSVTGADGSSWRNNTMSYTTDLDASDGITGFVERVDETGAPLEFLPRTAEEQAFNDAHSGDDCQEPCGARWALWPGPIVEDAAHDRALIVYSKIYGEPGEWNFHSVGIGIAVWEDFAGEVSRPVVRPGTDHPTLLFTADEPPLSSAAVVRDGDLYLFGCGGDGKICKLARAPLAEVLDRAAWRFYAGDDSWSEDAEAAVGLFAAMDITTVHWNQRMNAWLAFYSPAFENRVMVRSAPELTGPWSPAAQVIESLAPTDDPDHVAYSGLGHSEYAREGGRFEYLTYYRGTRPWHGELRLVEVELP